MVCTLPHRIVGVVGRGALASLIRPFMVDLFGIGNTSRCGLLGQVRIRRGLGLLNSPIEISAYPHGGLRRARCVDVEVWFRGWGEWPASVMPYTMRSWSATAAPPWPHLPTQRSPTQSLSHTQCLLRRTLRRRAGGEALATRKGRSCRTPASSCPGPGKPRDCSRGPSGPGPSPRTHSAKNDVQTKQPNTQIASKWIRGLRSRAYTQ